MFATFVLCTVADSVCPEYSWMKLISTLFHKLRPGQNRRFSDLFCCVPIWADMQCLLKDIWLSCLHPNKFLETHEPPQHLSDNGNSLVTTQLQNQVSPQKSSGERTEDQTSSDSTMRQNSSRRRKRFPARPWVGLALSTPENNFCIRAKKKASYHITRGPGQSSNS